MWRVGPMEGDLVPPPSPNPKDWRALFWLRG